MPVVPLVPPRDARIHRVQVKANSGLSWRRALMAAGSGTVDINIKKAEVGKLYPRMKRGKEVTHTLILLNYLDGKDRKWEQALRWAQQVGLELTGPRDIFPLPVQYPKLNQEFGLKPMCVFSTTVRVFWDQRRTPYVWWGEGACGAGFDLITEAGVAFDWFAFKQVL